MDRTERRLWNEGSEAVFDEGEYYVQRKKAPLADQDCRLHIAFRRRCHMCRGTGSGFGTHAGDYDGCGVPEAEGTGTGCI